MRMVWKESLKTYSKVAKLKKLCRDLLFIMEAKDFFTNLPIDTDDLNIAYKITIHHINGNHNDNRPENMAVSLTRNHKAYHCSKTMKGRSKK